MQRTSSCFCFFFCLFLCAQVQAKVELDEDWYLPSLTLSGGWDLRMGGANPIHGSSSLQISGANLTVGAEWNIRGLGVLLAGKVSLNRAMAMFYDSNNLTGYTTAGAVTWLTSVSPVLGIGMPSLRTDVDWGVVNHVGLYFLFSAPGFDLLNFRFQSFLEIALRLYVGFWNNVLFYVDVAGLFSSQQVPSGQVIKYGPDGNFHLTKTPEEGGLISVNGEGVSLGIIFAF